MGLINLEQNRIMKIFTLISLLLMPATLVASFYGMNVPNGLENNPLAFVGIVVLTTVITVLGAFWLKKKGMF